MAVLLYGITLSAFLGYSSQYLLKGLSLPPGQAAFITSMYGISGIICALPLGALADRIGRQHVLRLSALFILIGGTGIFLVGANPLALSIFSFLFGAGVAYPGLSAAIGQDSVGGHAVGTVSGLIFFMFGVGQIFGGSIFALLLPIGFVNAGLISLGVPSLLTVILCLFVSNAYRASHSDVKSGKAV